MPELNKKTIVCSLRQIALYLSLSMSFTGCSVLPVVDTPRDETTAKSQPVVSKDDIQSRQVVKVKLNH